MVQRDYVRRKSQSKKNKSRLMPKLMTFTAFVLVVLFSATLHFLSKNKPNKPAEPPKKITQSPAITLPEEPQERWTYLKALETPNASSGSISNSVTNEKKQIIDSFANNNSSIPPQNQANAVTQLKSEPENPVSKADSMTNKWLLQCGAFKDKTNADALKAKLAMFGINSNIISEQLYRVTVGPYTSKNEADKAMNSLKNNGIDNCIIFNK
ncbi:SPOR domain-containing protein [uncultured Gilliamella sp.]|uniref:SPOR domain-containing protein n=1 Tax=uncultured Gilliamella sp. TaxID=1193505 RepID=UPI0025F18515|nr:SPOR domain-containing protein [uncultured Gilliamella sp.]